MFLKSVALLAAGLFATGTLSLPQSPDATTSLKVKKQNSCTQTYTDFDTVLDFEGLAPHCLGQLGPCPAWGQHPLVYDGRGAGYVSFGAYAPILLRNSYNWYVVQCAAPEFAGKPEALACGTSAKALLSPGSSPYDNSLPARFNTVDFPNYYLYFNLKSLYITPIVNGTDTKATVTFTGTKKSGAKVTHTVSSIDNQKRSLVTLPNTFVDLVAFDTAVKKIGGGAKLYAFGLDDVSITEHKRDDLPPSCQPPIPTGVLGPCMPQPTETKKVTINFDDVTIKTGDVLTDLPISYKGLTWPIGAFVYTQQTINSIYGQVRMRPGETIPPSGNNFLHSIGKFEWAAATQEERFGVDELSILCEFPPTREDDYLNQNGQPCVLTFVGHRDRFSGDGLPETVKATITIPNPGDNAVNRPFKKIKLADLTTSPGAFSRLVRFNLFSEIGGNLYGTGFALDNVVVTRYLGEGTQCRAPGLKTMNFDDLAANSYVPTVYKDFRFNQNAFKVTRGSDFPAGSAARLASVSAPNSAKSQRDPYVDPSLTSIVSPIVNSLFHLESLTITLDVDPTNAAALAALNVYVSIQDACGTAGQTVLGGDRYREMQAYYTFQTRLGKSQIVFTYPYYAISKVTVSAAYEYGSGFENLDSPAVFIDSFKYRTYDGKMPGCQRCGWRGYSFCEIPGIQR